MLINLILTDKSYADELKKEQNENISFLTYDLNTLKQDQPTDTTKVSVFFSSFPFEKSIKLNQGNGENMIISFLDANCFDCINNTIGSKILSGKEEKYNLTNYVFLFNKYNKKSDSEYNINDVLWCIMPQNFSDNTSTLIKTREYALKDWFNYKQEAINKNLPDLKNSSLLNEWIKKNHYEDIVKKLKNKECVTPINNNSRFLKELFPELSKSTFSLIFSNGLQINGIDLSLDNEERSNTINLTSILNYVKETPYEVEGFEQLNDNKTIELIRFFK